jgi:hypothetical protein
MWVLIVNGASAIPAWVPLAVTALQFVLLPLVLIALDSRIQKAVKGHDGDPTAHPVLADIHELKGQIGKLGDIIVDLRLAVERITPRRRHGDYGGDDGS